MFQSFDVLTDPSQGRERVAQLRALLSERGLDGFLVPRADQHQGEYVAACSERLQWLTGFTGSAGAALVLAHRAMAFVDGRYTLQARGQVDQDTFSVENLVEQPPAAWLGAHAQRGSRIGFDPWLHTIAEARRLREALARRGAELVAVEANLVDELWTDRPAAPSEPVAIHPLALSGELAKDKIARLQRLLRDAGADHAVLTDPASLAWTFNIRGGDIPHTPVVLAFAILSAKERPRIYINRARLDIETAAYLTQLADLRSPGELEADLAKLAKDARVSLDPVLAADRLRALVEDAGGTVLEAADPARLPRATKNETEIAGARAAQRRDGLAMARFLHWLDSREPGTVDEIDAVRALEGFRVAVGDETQMPLRDISFDTISGAGSNGAIIHYRVTQATNRRLAPGELYLVDSGGQYADGTTDITRTVAIGAPDEEMRRHYTIVLKGLIAISRLRFPTGTRGLDIDPFARHAHWQAGLDFAHGTGHGVGSFLSVHEGPQRIARTGTQALLPGMILSNEPGYYREGAYGIRLENLIVVGSAESVEGGEIAMHGFETLTLAPFDRRLVATDMLEDGERAWLDAYHARVAAEIGPMADGEVRAWLEAATAPLR